MNRHPDRDRLRALDGVEPPEQWDDIVLRADTDLPRLQLQPARSAHRLLVAAVLLVMAGVAGVLVISTASGDRGELEAVAADGGRTPARPSGGGATPGTAATTPDGLPVPNTTPGQSGGGNGDGGSSGSGSGSGTSGGGTNGSPGGGMVATTTAATEVTTTSAVAPSTTSATGTTVAPPTDGSAGGEPPTDPPASPVWGKRYQVLLMAQGGVSRPMGTDRLLSLDARNEGDLVLVVCNTVAATAMIEDDHLIVTLTTATDRSCGEPLDGHEAFLTAFLDDDPAFAVDGNRLVLTVGNRRVELTSY